MDADSLVYRQIAATLAGFGVELDLNSLSIYYDISITKHQLWNFGDQIFNGFQETKICCQASISISICRSLFVALVYQMCAVAIHVLTVAPAFLVAWGSIVHVLTVGLDWNVNQVIGSNYEKCSNIALISLQIPFYVHYVMVLHEMIVYMYFQNLL